MSQIPHALRQDFRIAKRLEWWTLGWMGSVLIVMYLVMGSSQAMKAALVEDVLSLVPAMTFLISAHMEGRAPTRKFPDGFLRVNTLAFFASAVVLAFMGAFLIFESVMALAKGEHPTIGPVTLFGQTFWTGWLMIAALIYSVVPPLILGHLKKPIAERMRDKVLHTDALMQKADWQTGLAGVAGVLGIGFGVWWADSLAALLIALSILYDGIRSIRSASSALVDGAPRELEGNAIAEEAIQLQDRLAKRWPQAEIRLRESGRYFMASLDGVDDPGPIPAAAELMGDGPEWRLGRLRFSPLDHHPPGQQPDTDRETE